MRKKTKFFLKTIAGVGISAFLILLILQNIEISNVLSIIQKANIFYILMASLVYLASFIFRTLRWDSILTKIEKKKFTELFSILVIGWGANNILPARMGEVVRAYLLKIKKGAPFVYSLSTIILEKIFDVVVLSFFVLSVFLFYPLPEWAAGISALVAVIFLFLIFILFAINLKKDFFLSKMVKIIPSRKISSFISSAIDGTEILNKRKAQYHAWLSSILVWLLELGAFYLVVISLNIDVPFFVVVLCLVVVNFGIMIPSAPGYIGTFEAFSILVLTSFGISAPVSLAYAILLHGIQYITTMLITIFSVMKESISFKTIISNSIGDNK